MATNRTTASRFESRYGGGFVTPAQYITECLCVLIARSNRKELQDNFWNDDEWRKTFRYQVTLANRLLKKYPPEVILATLRDRRCWKVKSFGANWLLGPILKEKQQEHDAQVAQQSETVRTKTSTVQKPRRVSTGKKSLFTQLKEAE
jgi:predicted RNA-binding protein with PIN domain